jgi:hypothetical protein
VTTDLSSDLERISRHIPCLEAAVRSAPTAAARAVAVVELAVWRMAREIAVHDRTASDVAEQNRTEENSG